MQRLTDGAPTDRHATGAAGAPGAGRETARPAKGATRPSTL